MGNVNPADRLKDGGELGITTLQSWPVLTFHGTHSANVKLSHDRRKARRVDGVKGICFSCRPVCMGERIYLRVVDTMNPRSGALHFGFTVDDPATITTEDLSRYAYPDLTNEQGYWAKAVPESYAQRGCILYFYIVVGTGEVRYGYNGEEMGVFFSGVQTNAPLWALLDLNGSTSAVEFIEGVQVCPAGSSISVGGSSLTIDHSADGRYYLLPSMCPANIHHHGLLSTHSSPSLPLPVAPAAHDTVESMAFHQLCGRNVSLSANRLVATRITGEYCNGYVFTQRPLRPGDRMLVCVSAVEREYIGSLTFGVTSCDPGRLRQDDLPDDADMLLDRPEYWVVHKDTCIKPEVGDELSFMLCTSGEVRYSRNGHYPSTLMHVDATLQLWAFFDIYGSTKELKSIGVVAWSPGSISHVEAHCHHSISMPTHSGHSTMRPASEPRLSLDSMEGGRSFSHRLSIDSADSTGGGGRSPFIIHHCRNSQPAEHDQLSRTVVIRRAYDRGDQPVCAKKCSRTPTSSTIASKLQPSAFDTPLEELSLPQPLIPVPSASAKPSVKPKPHNVGKNQIPSSPQHQHVQYVQQQQQIVQQQLRQEQPTVLSPTLTPPPVPVRRSLNSASERPMPSAATVGLASKVSSDVLECVSLGIEKPDVSPRLTPFVPVPAPRQISAPPETKNGSPAPDVPSNECAVCLETAPNCVLYTCGHMCMCYQCAIDVVQNRGALCPICRQPIRDVIKIYRS